MSRALWVIVISLFLSACASPSVKRAALKKEPFDCSGKPSIASVIGTGSVVVSEGGVLKGRATIYVKRPDKIRLEIYGPMNRIMAVIAGSGNECALFDAENGVGDCTDRAAMLVEAGSGLFAALLTGDHEGPVLNGGAFNVTKDADGRVVTVEKEYGRGGLLKLEAKGYGNFSCGHLPSKIEIVKDGSQAATIEIVSYKINPDIDDRVFDLVQ